MADNELERIYTIPLRKVKAGSSNKAANRAIREVRTYLEKHMKSTDVWIDDAVNRQIWAHGMYRVPSKIRVRAIKFEDGVVEVSLPEEEATTSIRDTLREARESKTPILPTPSLEEEEEEEGERAAGEIEAEPETETGEIEAEPEEPAGAETDKKPAEDEGPADDEHKGTQ